MRATKRAHSTAGGAYARTKRAHSAAAKAYCGPLRAAIAGAAAVVERAGGATANASTEPKPRICADRGDIFAHALQNVVDRRRCSSFFV